MPMNQYIFVNFGFDERGAKVKESNTLFKNKATPRLVS
jgi:hypothetical protein